MPRSGIAGSYGSSISSFFFFNFPSPLLSGKVSIHTGSDMHMAKGVYLEALGFPGGSTGKESTCHVGDLGSVPGLGRSPGERNGYPFQDSGLEKSGLGLKE